VKLIFFGDFLQLPPVMDTSLIDCDDTLAGFYHVDLKQIMRQKDVNFRQFLERVRTGYYDEDDVLQYMTDDTYDDDDQMLRLFCTRERVRIWNNAKFNQLDTPPRLYPCATYEEFNMDESRYRIRDIS